MKFFGLGKRKPLRKPRFEGGDIVRWKKDYPDDDLKVGDCGVIWAAYPVDPPFYEASIWNDKGEARDISFDDYEVEDTIEIIDIRQASNREHLEDFLRGASGNEFSPILRDFLAKKYLGNATLEDHVDWAVAELVSGADTPNLRILAGLTKPLYWPEVEHHFSLTLEELKVSLPLREPFLRDYVYEVARRIVADKIIPTAGCHTIYQISASLDYPPELSNWVCLNEGMEPGTYGNLTGAKLHAAIEREAENLCQRMSNLPTIKVLLRQRFRLRST